MATVVQLRSGNWRAQVRRGSKYAARSFPSKEEAEAWAFALERQIDVPAKTTTDANRWTLEELIDRYLQDRLVLGRDVGRPRQAYLEQIRSTLGKLKPSEFTRPKLIEYGRAPALEGAKPATVLCDFVRLRAIMTHVEAVHGIPFQHRHYNGYLQPLNAEHAGKGCLGC